MKSYKAARAWFGFTSYCAWWIIIIGVIVAVAAFMTLGNMRGALNSWLDVLALLGVFLPGLGISFFGFLCLVVVQMGRAGVDTAEYAQQGLKVARDQLEISRQSLLYTERLAKSYAELQARTLASAAAEASVTTPNAASFANVPEGEDRSVEVAHTIGETIPHRGKSIRVLEAGYSVDGSVYPSLGDAKSLINDMATKFPENFPEPDVREADISAAHLAKLGADTRS